MKMQHLLIEGCCTTFQKQIYKNEDNYMLRFLLGGKEVYTIPYNDISYPENAEKILSDQIISAFLNHNDSLE